MIWLIVGIIMSVCGVIACAVGVVVWVAASMKDDEVEGGPDKTDHRGRSGVMGE